MEDYLVIKNPNEKQREYIKSKLKQNGGYCISQPKSEKTKCKCEHYKKTHECMCGLFIKVPVIEVT